MNDELKAYIYNNLDQKDTDELVEIWQKNDRSQWSDETFEVLEQIIRHRLTYLPPQNEPILKAPEQLSPDSKREVLALGSLDDENSPIFYDPREVLMLSKWIYRLAIANVVIMIILALDSSRGSFPYIWTSLFETNQLSDGFFALSILLIRILGYVIFSIIGYFILRALSSLLKVIMEMEFNSRR